MLDLTLPGALKAVSKTVLAEIDAYCVATYNDGFRNHLGASLIGRECERMLWYGFRWAKEVVHTGRLYRLFNRGHREEARFVEWLTGIGFTVQELNPETGKQWRVSALHGHYGGSCDGVAYLPARYDYPHKLLTEYKTNGTGAGFNKVVEKGVTLAKPDHFAQQSTYGRYMGIEYSLYGNINKNDDSLHIEIVKLDHKYAEDLERKAFRIVSAQTAPRRISDARQFTACAICDYVDVCHDGKALARNCRSCKHAEAREEASWFCNQWGATIPTREALLAGCPNWTPIA